MISDAAPFRAADSPLPDVDSGAVIHVAAPPAGGDSATPPYPATPLALPLLSTPSPGPGGPLDPTPSSSPSAKIANTTNIETHLPAPAELSAADDYDAEASMTIEGELTMAERTLVEDTVPREEGEDAEVERKLRHVKGPSSSSLSLIARGHARKASASASSVGHVVQRSVDGHADPLRMAEEAGCADADTPHVEEESEESRPVAKARRRASHLRLDTTQPPSPMPWEVVPPPLENNLTALAGYYSPTSPAKFRTLQNAGCVAFACCPIWTFMFIAGIARDRWYPSRRIILGRRRPTLHLGRRRWAKLGCTTRGRSSGWSEITQGVN